MNIGEATAERLEAFEYFSPEVIARVSEVAELQAEYPDAETAIRDMLPRDVTSESTHYNPGEKPLTVFDRDPNGVMARSVEAVMLHPPLNRPLSPAGRYWVGSIASVLREHRVIAIGTQGGPPYRSGGFPKQERRALAEGNLEPIVTRNNRILESAGVEMVSHVGLSSGANVAIESALGSVPVEKVVAIDPLAGDFGATPDGFALARGFGEAYMAGLVPSTPDSMRQAVKASPHGIESLLGIFRLTSLSLLHGIGLQNVKERTMLVNRMNPTAEVAFVFNHKSVSEAPGDSLVPRSRHISATVLGMSRRIMMTDFLLQSAIIAETIGVGDR